MIYFIILLVLIILCFWILGLYLSAPRYKGPVSDHFNGKLFINPGNVKAKGLREVLKWLMTRERGVWSTKYQEKYGEKPVARVTEGVRITFVNHSTFLIQVDGFNILTDPIWSERTSPFTWAGPKRMRLPGIRIEDLPKIDLILLSHNHYDHLDLSTLKNLFKQHQPKIITPLGVKAFLDDEKITTADDMDWWDVISVSEKIQIQSVPAQHFSGRGSFDRDATLWCGYVIKRDAGNIYFAGDTGYNPVTFKEIGNRCAPIEVALIPIGAYKPSWFMSPIHCSPEEAVQIHKEVKAKHSIGTHFGTFPLADDGHNEPINDLEKAKSKYNLAPNEFIVLNEGEARIF